MHTTSELYKSIFADPRHLTEIKLDIAGMEYGQDAIISCSTHGALFESLSTSIGNCIAREIDFEIYPSAVPPRQAQIKLYARVVLGTQASEWIPKGVFFFSTRAKDKLTGVLSVTGYDAMLKAETVWLNSDYDTENWPMSAADAVDDIAYRMGVEIDPRTDLTGARDVDYPVDENGDMTMRQVLAGIAVSCEGNWMITDEGKLLLWRYGDVPDETNYLADESGFWITFGGVRILV